jgi:hypothetical protein
MGLRQCELCGMTYVEGDPLDEQRHNEDRHAGFMEAVAPEPSVELKAAYLGNPEIVWVDNKSPEWLRRSVYWRAKVFQREFRYDTPQWEIEGRHDPKAIGYVFRDDDFRIIGACCFRPLESGSEQMLLDWIWLSPMARRTGVVSRKWNEFRERFGDFRIGGPVSGAMLTFLQNRFPVHGIIRSSVHEPVIPMEQFATTQHKRP